MTTAKKTTRTRSTSTRKKSTSTRKTATKPRTVTVKKKELPAKQAELRKNLRQKAAHQATFLMLGGKGDPNFETADMRDGYDNLCG